MYIMRKGGVFGALNWPLERLWEQGEWGRYKSANPTAEKGSELARPRLVSAESSIAMSSSRELGYSAEDFLGLLQKTEGMLDAVARKIDDEFAERYKNSGVRITALDAGRERVSWLPSMS